MSIRRPPIIGPKPSPIAYDALKTAEISPKRLIDSAYLLLQKYDKKQSASKIRLPLLSEPFHCMLESTHQQGHCRTIFGEPQLTLIVSYCQKNYVKTHGYRWVNFWKYCSELWYWANQKARKRLNSATDYHTNSSHFLTEIRIKSSPENKLFLYKNYCIIFVLYKYLWSVRYPIRNPTNT